MLALQLVSPQQQKIEKAVAEGLPAQGRQALGKGRRQELRLVVQAVEIFADDRRVVDSGAVVEHERRNLGQRVVSHQLCMWLGRGAPGSPAVAAVPQRE